MEGVGMTPKGRYTAQIVVSVTPEVRETLERMADDEGVSLAHVARRLLDAGLDTPRQPILSPQALRRAARELVQSGEAQDFAEALQMAQEASEDPDTI